MLQEYTPVFDIFKICQVTLSFMQKNPRSFGTHDGTFHADEVTACALLLLFGLIDKDKIIRSRDSAILGQCEYVCDVGGVWDPEKKLFDHHQVDYQGSMSSAGMVLLYLKNQDIITSQAYEFFNHSLVLGVDAHDNGLEPLSPGYCSFSNLVSNFTPIQYDVDSGTQNEAFLKALDFVYHHLDRLWKRYIYMQSCRNLVSQTMNKKQKYLLFDQPVPWIDLFFEMNGLHHPALFVIMPAGVHWKLRAIPPTIEERMKVRVPLPKEWAGFSNRELQKITGILGAVFCHKGRFISVWETREDALKALNMVLESTKDIQ